MREHLGRPNRTVASVSIAALDGTVASTGPPDHLGAHVGASAGLYAYPPDGWRGPMTIGAEIGYLNVQRAYLLTRSAPGGA
ncbi:hypothetical protein [Pseudactinotalea sp.]|uniref:hypothetical protein n=1 Tax=Pseudactinotalea sp. TaxID=1926260 RepID=UPI003B3ADF3C